MMHRLFVCCSLGVLLTTCLESAELDAGGGSDAARRDVSEADASGVDSTGQVAGDAGGAGVDAGGNAGDAGGIGADAGGGVGDTGGASVDAGGAAADAGGTKADAGSSTSDANENGGPRATGDPVVQIVSSVSNFARVGSLVVLDGSGSSSTDGSRLTFFWTQLTGPSFVLPNTEAPVLELEVLEPGLYGFELRVEDGDGHDAETSSEFVVVEANAGVVTNAEAIQTALDSGAPVYLRAGDYYLTQSLRVRTSRQKLSAFPGEKPVLHGGPKIEGWTEGPDSVWTTRYASPTCGDLFVGGRRQIHARFPNEDPEDRRRKGWLLASGGTTETISAAVNVFYEGIELPVEHVSPGMKISIFPSNGFAHDVFWVDQIIPANHTLTLVHEPGVRHYSHVWTGRFFLFDFFEALDAPREWYHDKAAEVMHYIPYDNSFDGGEVPCGALVTAISVEDAFNVVISGLTIQGTSPWDHPASGSGLAHRLAHFQNEDWWTHNQGAIRAKRANGLTIEDCILRNTGIAIALDASGFTTIRNNDIADSADTAILVDDLSRDHSSDVHVLEGNLIRSPGYRYRYSHGIAFAHSDDVVVRNNRIEDSAYAGILASSRAAHLYRTTIEYNSIHHTNLESADGGAVYFLGRHKQLMGSTIRYNLITGTRNMHPTSLEVTSWFNGNAIYPDDFTSGVHVYGNMLIDNVSGVLIHGGWENRIENNILIQSGMPEGLMGALSVQDIEVEGAPAQKNNVFRRNIVFGAGNRNLVRYSAAQNVATYDENLYWDTDGLNEEQLRIAGNHSNFAEWQRDGFDNTSIVAKPLFRSPEDGDYHLMPASPAYSLGFMDLPDAVFSSLDAHLARER